MVDNAQPELNEIVATTIALVDVNEVPFGDRRRRVRPRNARTRKRGVPGDTRDPDWGQQHSWAIVSGDPDGDFQIDQDGRITLAAALDYESTSGYQLEIEATDDGTPAEHGTATVVVDINARPVANPQSVAITSTAGGPIVLSGYDPDPLGAELGFTVADPPSKGMLDGSGANLTYTPTPGQIGADSFTFVINDGAMDSLPATVSISIELPPIDTWKAVNFGAQAGDPAVAGDVADPDFDMILNLMEYGLAHDPMANQSAAGPYGRMPVIEADGDTVALVYRRNLDATDLSFVVEQSVNLGDPGSWQPATVSEETVDESGNVRVVRAVVGGPHPSPFFLRLRVARLGP